MKISPEVDALLADPLIKRLSDLWGLQVVINKGFVPFKDEKERMTTNAGLASYIGDTVKQLHEKKNARTS